MCCVKTPKKLGYNQHERLGSAAGLSAVAGCWVRKRLAKVQPTASAWIKMNICCTKKFYFLLMFSDASHHVGGCLNVGKWSLALYCMHHGVNVPIDHFELSQWWQSLLALLNFHPVSGKLFSLNLFDFGPISPVGCLWDLRCSGQQKAHGEGC